MAETTRCEICDRTFKDIDGLAAHNKAKHPELVPKEKKPTPIKKIRNWAIFIVIISLIVWGVYSLISNINEGKIIDESQLTFDAPKSPIHWHPSLSITIDGKKTVIPANIVIIQMHTHDASGVIHMENNRPTKKTVTLGYFFEVWNKKISKDCIFEYCTDKGTLKMYVNGQENLEFENYFMQDKDEILIEYTTKGN